MVQDSKNLKIGYCLGFSGCFKQEAQAVSVSTGRAWHKTVQNNQALANTGYLHLATAKDTNKIML